MKDLTLERLRDAVENDAAIRSCARLVPLFSGARVMPPTYPGASGPRYATERRILSDGEAVGARSDGVARATALKVESNLRRAARPAVSFRARDRVEGVGRRSQRGGGRVSFRARDRVEGSVLAQPRVRSRVSFRARDRVEGRGSRGPLLLCKGSHFARATALKVQRRDNALGDVSLISRARPR